MISNDSDNSVWTVEWSLKRKRKREEETLLANDEIR